VGFVSRYGGAMVALLVALRARQRGVRVSADPGEDHIDAISLSTRSS
jgi:hypothetical protein